MKPSDQVDAESILECEHADHEDYLFAVEVDGPEGGWVNGLGEPVEGPAMYPETHALIYTDGCIALTLYECCYFLWGADDGAPLGGSIQDTRESLSESARAQIVAYVKDRDTDERDALPLDSHDATIAALRAQLATARLLVDALPRCLGPWEPNHCGTLIPRRTCTAPATQYIGNCEDMSDAVCDACAAIIPQDLDDPYVCIDPLPYADQLREFLIK